MNDYYTTRITRVVIHCHRALRDEIVALAKRSGGHIILTENDSRICADFTPIHDAHFVVAEVTGSTRELVRLLRKHNAHEVEPI